MKLIRCVLRPDSVTAVVEALTSLTTGMTVLEARDSSGEPHPPIYYRGLKYEVAIPKIVIEIVTDDSWADDIVARVIQIHRTAVLGDGRIYVCPVEASYHVRNGFMDI